MRRQVIHYNGVSFKTNIVEKRKCFYGHPRVELYANDEGKVNVVRIGETRFTEAAARELLALFSTYIQANTSLVIEVGDYKSQDPDDRVKTT